VAHGGGQPGGEDRLPFRRGARQRPVLGPAGLKIGSISAWFTPGSNWSIIAS
jgi:hypothetical protein